MIFVRLCARASKSVSWTRQSCCTSIGLAPASECDAHVNRTAPPQVLQAYSESDSAALNAEADRVASMTDAELLLQRVGDGSGGLRIAAESLEWPAVRKESQGLYARYRQRRPIRYAGACHAGHRCTLPATSRSESIRPRLADTGRIGAREAHRDGGRKVASGAATEYSIV